MHSMNYSSEAVKFAKSGEQPRVQDH